MPDIKHAFSYNVDLDQGLLRPLITTLIGGGDAEGDTVSVSVTRGGTAVTLTGATCRAYFVRADGSTVYIDGTVSGSSASVTLPASCYIYDGDFTLSVKLTSGDVTATVLVLHGQVILTGSDRIVDPGTMYPSLPEIMAMIAAKIDEPAEEGENGMALTTDGNGGRTWQDVAASTIAGTLQVDGTNYILRTGSAGASGYITILTEA